MMSNAVLPGDAVSTIFGEGVVEEVRDSGMTVIRVSNWKLANNKTPTLYMNPESFRKVKEAAPSKGDKVTTIFGEGYIDEVRGDGLFVIILSIWKLANNQSPTLYLNAASFKRTSASKPAPSTNDLIKSAAAELFAQQKADRERAEKAVDMAVEYKDAGAKHFKAGEFAEAKMKYQEALGVAQGLQQEVSNELKARIFELCVPLHTNVAVCAMKLKDYSDSIVFAKNSLMLIDALSNKLKDSALWRVLLGRGWSETKLMVDMKKKSLFLLGKAEYFSSQHENAIFHFEQALAAIDWALGDLAKKDGRTEEGAPAREKRRKDLQREAVDIRDFLDKAQKRMSAEAKKEKKMWSKAFNKNNSEPEAASAASSASVSRTSSSGADLGAIDMKIDMSKLGLSSGTLRSSSTSPAPSISPKKKTKKSAVSTEDDAGDEDNALAKPTDNFVPMIITSCFSLLGIVLFGLGWRYRWFKR